MIKCKKGHIVQPLKSCAGYYLGSMEDGEPYCRISSNYVNTISDAHKLNTNRQYCCMENEWCNGGNGCGLYEI